MGKIVLLVPREEMVRQAHNILQEKKYQIHEMRVCETKSAVMEARRAIADGASIIIARGLQASLIKKYTDIPVVEIVLTAQEMALLVMRARQIVGKSRPIIAVVGFKNMFCDMSFFDELYGIELRTYFANEDEELSDITRTAIEGQVDLVIGGDTVVSIAEEHQVPSLFLSMTEDSLRNAFSTAEMLDYAMYAEKKTAAQMETILDYSYNGVLQVDSNGVITTVNTLMEDLVEIEQEELVGKNICTVIPQIDEDVCTQVLKDGKEYTMFLEWKQVSLFVSIAPVFFEEQIEGAVLTCHRMVKKHTALSRKEHDKIAHRVENDGFDHVLQKSKKMQECIRKARVYALSEFPLVLRGETGTEKRILALGIHGSSDRAYEPFVDVSCVGMTGEEQRNLIFGERGVVFQAQRGTLLLQDAEKLTSESQYRLYQLIRYHVCHGVDGTQFQNMSVRVMLAITEPLVKLVAEGRLLLELYYLFSGHELYVPALRERPEDLKQKIDDMIREYRRKYNRYHVLTKGALDILYKYPWKGNLVQLESFCDTLILTADKRSLDEIAVKELLKELYPETVMHQSTQENIPVAESPFAYNQEAQRIVAILRKHGGNREKTAQELGISKATLWRHMKKYEIELK